MDGSLKILHRATALHNNTLADLGTELCKAAVAAGWHTSLRATWDMKSSFRERLRLFFKMEIETFMISNTARMRLVFCRAADRVLLEYIFLRESRQWTNSGLGMM